MDIYRELDHTADIRLEVYGDTIQELFINSVKGLFHIISKELEVANSPSVFPEKSHPVLIELNAPTYDELLLHWLNEFIYYFFVKGKVPNTIKISELEESSLRAEVEFIIYSKTLEISLEVKAATYHNLSVEKIGNKYKAKIIFDV